MGVIIFQLSNGSKKYLGVKWMKKKQVSNEFKKNLAVKWA